LYLFPVSSFPLENALAPHQGRQAASAGRHSLIVGGWLGALGKTAPFEIPNAKGCANRLRIENT